MRRRIHRCVVLAGGIMLPPPMFFGGGWTYGAATMTDALTTYRLDSLKLELGGNRWLSVIPLGHNQYQNSVAVRCVGERPIHRLRQSDFTVVRARRPFLTEQITPVLTWAALDAADGYTITCDVDDDILGF